MREELPEQVTPDNDIKELRGGHVDTWGKSVRGRRNSNYKGPEVGACLEHGGQARSPRGWSRGSEGGRAGGGEAVGGAQKYTEPSASQDIVRMLAFR